MPRVTSLQTNFSAGEVSPRLYGRVDVARYANGARAVRNGNVLLQGGVARSYGSLFVKAAKLANKRARLIPYVFNRSQAYVLEFGDLYMRVFRADGTRVETSPGVAYEIVTPYTEAMLAALDYSQGADTMFLWHESVPTQRLQRFAETNWVLAQAPWVQPPVDEIGERIGQIGTLSAATVGAGRTLNVGSALFLSGDVGRTVSAGAGFATITAVGGPTSATVEITRAFDSVTLAAQAWIIDASPRATITPSAKDPVGASITLTAGATVTEAAKAITGLAWAAGVVTVTIAAHGYSSGNQVQISGVDAAGFNGTYAITVTAANTFTYPLATDPGLPVALGQARRVLAGTGAWRSSHVGGYVRINDGLVLITSVTSATAAVATIVAPLGGVTPAPADAWSLEFPVWNQYDGYPRTGTLWEQRTIAAGTPRFPQTVWGTRTGEYLNWMRGVFDDDGFSFAIASDEINPIVFVAASRTLLAFTYGGEFTLQGGIEKPIAPTNVQIRARSNHGCAQVRPVRVGREEVFVQRAGRKLRAFSYNATNDDYTAPDITVLAEHLTAPAITELAWQKSPEPWLWALRSDGRLACCTYELQDENVVAWTLRETGGGADAVESIAVIPDSAGNEALWAIVRRTAAGGTQRYVERFTSSILTDCGVIASAGVPATAWSGLSHLDGRTVAVVADGAYAGEFPVAAGAITLPRAASAVQIGLPYTTRVELLTPELQMGEGSAQGNSMRIGEVTLRLLGSVGGTINGQHIPTRRLDVPTLDLPPEEASGLERVENLGWERGEAELVIEQDAPLPFTLLSVVRKITVNS